MLAIQPNKQGIPSKTRRPDNISQKSRTKSTESHGVKTCIDLVGNLRSGRVGPAKSKGRDKRLKTSFVFIYDLGFPQEATTYIDHKEGT